MNQRYLENYAKLLVQTGISAQHGERLEISFSEESLPLLRLVVDEAYRAGVRQIYYNFQDDACAVRSCAGMSASLSPLPLPSVSYSPPDIRSLNHCFATVSSRWRR